jgi:hypothetical protein
VKSYEIENQGHFWIEGAWVRAQRPGLYVIELESEQKRPTVYGYVADFEAPSVIVGRREESFWGNSLHFRDGEDGSEATTVKLPLPRHFPWRKWNFRFDQDKWSIIMVAWTEPKRLWEYRWYNRWYVPTLRKLRRNR